MTPRSICLAGRNTSRLAGFRSTTSVLLLVVGACSGGGGGDKASSTPTAPASVLTTVNVTLSTARLQIGQAATASASGLDQNGAAMTLGAVTWSSSNPAIANVSANGSVSAVGLGQSSITATSGSKSGSAVVTVATNAVAVSTVTITPATASVAVGSTVDFTATARDAGGNVLSGRDFKWFQSNGLIASGRYLIGTITSVLTATGNGTGTATFSAVSEGQTGIATITVTAGGSTSSTAWISKADMPTVRTDLTTAVSNGLIYAIGGLDYNSNPLNPSLATLEVYSPATNTWAAKAAMPTARGDLGSATVNGVVYVFGGDNAIRQTANSNGFRPANTVEAYDPVTNTWSTKAPMPTPRERFAIAVVNGVIYLIGGLVPDGMGFVMETAGVEAYDPATNSWTTKAPMSSARSRATASVLNGIVYVIGGQSSTKVQAYDPATNSWTTKASTLSFNVGTSAAVGGIIYTVAGNFETYDAASNSWVENPALSTGYTFRSGSSLAVVGNVLYSIGGNDTFSILKTVEARSVP